MTQQEALEALQGMYPGQQVGVEVEVVIGARPKQNFYLWLYSEKGSSKIVGSSTRSFEHAIALARVERDFPPVVYNPDLNKSSLEAYPHAINTADAPVPSEVK